MRNEHETSRLSDYLDGELGPEHRAAVAAHLEVCSECRDTLDELRAVATAAGALPELPPERDLWPGIAARLAPRGGPVDVPEGDEGVIPLAVAGRNRRRVAMTVPQLMAAGVALVLFSAGAMWLTVTDGGAPGLPGADLPVAAGAAAAVSPATTVAFADFDRAIGDLEQEYEARREDLDPETIRIVERNLAIIDEAIGEARTALEADPSSQFLSAHLATAMRQKMGLLRQAAMIAQTET